MEEICKYKREYVEQKHLPEDLIIKEILPWLPIKSLKQCKSISKKWYSSISSNFLLNYIKQPLCPHLSSVLNCLFIQIAKNFYLYSCDPNDDNIEQVATYNKEENLVKLHVDFNLISEKINLVGSCNGLICLGEFHGKFFILWNPRIEQFHKYYLPDYQELIRTVRDPPYVVSWGFGYVSSQNDHKVVRSTACWNGELRIVHVFSMKANSWRRIECSLEDGFSFGKGRFVNEKLYWSMIIMPLSMSMSRSNRIVAFDLVLEKFEVLPDNFGPHVLTVMGGFLALGMCSKDGENSYVVKMIDIIKSPENVVSVRLCCGLNLRNFEDMIGFTKTGKMFVANAYPPSLSLVDDTSMQTLVTFEGIVERASIESYVPSQISPPPPAQRLYAVGQVT